MFNQFRANLIELFQEAKNRKDWLGKVFFTSILCGIVLIAIKEQIFVAFYGTKVSSFTIAIALIWIGVFNSVTSVCSIRAKITVQCMEGMKISSFVSANIVYQFIVSLLQTSFFFGLFWGLGHLFFDTFPTGGLILPIWLEYFVVMLVSIFSADMMGMAISSFCKDNESAMKVMPFLLVVQMIFSNALFDLPEAYHNALGYLTSFTISKWSIDLLGTVSNAEAMDGFWANDYPDITFVHSTEHFAMCMGSLAVLTVLWIVLILIGVSRIRKDRTL